MEELQVKFVVTNKNIYIGVVKATDYISLLFGYKTGETSIRSIIMDNFLNKELLNYIIGDTLHLRLISDSTTHYPDLSVWNLTNNTLRLVLKIPTGDNVYSNGLKKVNFVPSSTIIKGIFGEDLYDKMDQTEVKHLVALILSQFNLWDKGTDTYPNVSMGFSVIISNFEYDYRVLPEEFPDNEYSL